MTTTFDGFPVAPMDSDDPAGLLQGSGTAVVSVPMPIDMHVTAGGFGSTWST